MKVTLIRHTSVNVPQGTCYGWTDVPVADTFEAEAANVKARLEAHEPFDAVYSSPLTRATKLAAYCGHPDATLDDRLKELNMGEWEMQRYEDITDPYLNDWYNDYLHLPTRGGESFVQQYERVARFLDELRRKPYRNVAIFAHGGVLVAASIYAKAIKERGAKGLIGLMGATGSLEEAWQQVPPYGGIITLQL